MRRRWVFWCCMVKYKGKAVTVNRQLLELYWDLGREICEKQKKAEWGDGLIDQLAKDLSAAFPGMKGFSRRNLLYIRQWYVFYDGSGIVQQVAAQIPWWHNVVIITKCANVREALFYVQKTKENNWSRSMLVAQMESKLYERSGKIINNFDKTLSAPQADVVNAQLKHAQDQPSIGILLCKTPNKVIVEYALENILSPLGVAEYRITNAIPENLKGDLPSIEELEQELERR
jgi:predicted nuclease of restriction endonuclease-like (RecB) superfamily